MVHRPSRKRLTIGVLAGWQFYRTATNLSYLLPVFKGITQAAQDLGCSLLLGCGMGASASPNDLPKPAWPSSALDVDFVPIGPWNTDGLIIFSPLHSPERSRYVQDLITKGHPVIFIGSGEGGLAIVADNSGGIFEAVGHLVQHGHRQIAFIAGSQDDMLGDTGERLTAFQSAMSSFGLKCDPRLVGYGRHVYDGGYLIMCQMIESGVPFTAVIASNDESALGAMRALTESGRRIPDDVAVIGFDNRIEGAAHNPALASIHVPLFRMGHLAMEQLLEVITGKTRQSRVIRIGTQLMRRASCGCGSDTHLQHPRVERKSLENILPPALDEKRLSLINTIWATVTSQARNLSERESQSFCKQLVETFINSITLNDQSEFLRTFEDILQKTVAVEGDAYIWEEAVTIIGREFKTILGGDSPGTRFVDELIDQARLTISAHMQRVHRQYIANQRRISSRLSLLTADLQTALDEKQIIEILAQHLVVMDIPMAQIALFQAEGSDPVAWSLLRNALKPEQEPARFSSYIFPPQGLFPPGYPFRLVLIPIVAQAGKLGYAVFGTEQMDLYGAIVQQLGGALNSARLYRQATEGRRLAEEANRMKSRFLSTISHELRTPLNLIVGLSGMVLRANETDDTPLPEPTQKDIERIHAYSQHLGGLIGDVIDLASSDAGQLRLNNDFLELGQALQMIEESGRQLAVDKGLDWEADFPDTAAWVWGDQTRLRQVALNLINNAVKFTITGRVSLRMEIHTGFVKVVVSDTGLGISPEEQEVIFDEFRQSERSVAQGYGGLGLGLAISKRLIEMHGGKIGVESTGIEGAGSTFYFKLPLVSPPAGRANRPTLLSKARQNVMLLTNDPGSSKRLCEHLSMRGFKVQVVEIDAKNDWQTQLFKTLPNTVLLDVSTASGLGWDVLKAIKGSQSARDIPVLFYKSSQEDGSILELDYLTKPIELAELTRALDQNWLIARDDRRERTILVVDDEPNTLDLHARIVQSHASTNQVLKARNGREALVVMERELIDLVLLDLQMPEMDGFEVLEKMRESDKLRNIPVIVVTGKVLSEGDMARLNRGVAKVLEKGLFSLDETITHISMALEHKRRLSNEAQRLVRKAMAFIHEHFSGTISRQEIARHVNITEDHLTFCFRQELGITPIEYLQRYRINQAKHLLKESDRSITKIAMDVGYSDSGYFSRIFRRLTGVSPEVFRNT